MGESQGIGAGAAGLAGTAGLAEAAAAGAAGGGAAGLGSPSGGGEEGDLISSGMARNAQTYGLEGYGENVNFYQLEDTVSTSFGEEKRGCSSPANGAGWALYTGLRLIALDQIADAFCVFFAMAVAGDGVGAAGGLDANLGPEHAGRNMYRSDLRDGDALFVAAK